MPFDGNGVFVRLYNWVNDAAANIKIRADRMDAETDGIATGLSLCVTRDGQSPATADLPMGGFKHTGIGVGTARNHYAAISQVQDSTVLWGGTAGGTANAITITLSPVITAYAAGQNFSFLSSAANTGATTINVNSVGAKNITKNGTTALAAGDIPNAAIVNVRYDGTQFQLMGITPNVITNTGDQTITATDNGANVTPIITLDRNSASPAANDQLAEVRFAGRDSGGNVVNYGSVRGAILDPTDTTEDGAVDIYAIINGAFTRVARAGAGFIVGNTTDPGTGVIVGANGIKAGTGATVTSFLTNTAALDFPNVVAQGVQVLTMTVTGAATGDTVALGIPAGLANALVFKGWVSAADTVSIACINPSAAAIDPASATYRATVFKF